MKRVAAILSLVMASTAGAQGSFQGVVTYQIGKQNETMVYTGSGGSKVRIDVNDPRMQGGAAMIWDTGTNTMMMVMPSQKMYMTMSMDKMMANVPDTARGKFTKVGSEVIAGVPCDDYKGTSSNGGDEVTACIAHGMGNFLWFGGNNPMMQRMQSRVSGLGSAVAGGGFPLKVVKSDGTTEMLATKVDRHPVDPSLFSPPAGFTQMQIPAGMSH
jgi:Domain of unknown function (DUF4412)